MALRDWFREANMSVRSINVVTENAHVRRIERGALKVGSYATVLFKATVAKIAGISKSDRSLRCPDTSSS